MSDDLRPNPEAMLSEARKHRRGKLRLFLGMAPGVGKTYAMLSEAHQRRAAGYDVLIGWVDTHKRKETDALTRGLEILPRLRVKRGPVDEETLDLDEILRRRPSVAVIDEMPHSNPPGSRHAKRWQDIEELLEAGIDVWSALNIQHLESLNDVVERVTGVAVTETVPDRIFDEADEVRLIDLPPDDLLARLNAGKIYLPEVVERARDAYFRRSNLIALRELALRIMTSRMETQIRTERRRSTRRSIDDTGFGLLVVLESVSESAVREAARMARSLSSPWHVVWMESGRKFASNPEVEALLRFAGELGAKVDVLAGTYADEVSRYAREHNLSLVDVVAANRWIEEARRRALRRSAPELHLLELSRRGDATGPIALFKDVFGEFRPGFDGYVQAVVIVLLTLGLLLPLTSVMEPTNHAMLYLLGVLFCGIRYGSGPAALAAVLSVLAFDISIVQPRWSFAVSDTQYLITFAVMLIVGLAAGQLVAHRQRLVKSINEREHQTRMLFDAARELSGAVLEEDVYAVLRGRLHRHMNVESEYWRPTASDDPEEERTEGDWELERIDASLSRVDPAVVRWCFDHGGEAGAGTQTLSSSPYRYVPLMSGGHVRAVMVVSFSEPADGTGIRLVEALAALGALTLERIASGEEARRALVSMEAERMRFTLIQSLSHDLRTPITGFRLASEELCASAEQLVASEPNRRDAALERKILEDSENLRADAVRMERLVGNLLEMARLQSGRIKLNLNWIPAEELFGIGISELGDRLDRYVVTVEVEPDCPLVYCDEVLMVRVLANLLDNAVKYTPAGTHIVCSAVRRGNSVVLGVADNGPGLPQGNPQRLFDPFRRGQKEFNVTGVGLGLAICRTIARAHGAEIFATTSGMGGAAFTVVLPHVPVETLDNEETVLGAEDEPIEALESHESLEPSEIAQPDQSPAPAKAPEEPRA